MKLNDDGNIVTRHNIEEENTFTIKSSSKAFKILSNSLYSDKILAVIRELSCNAYDAHVEADISDVPFEIHLPTKMEPYFTVRDYGLGLSHEEINELYTSYFTSTKNTSNRFIGAMGLGSKSPFSYTDSFTINSTQNGITKSYSAFISDDNIPHIGTLGESTTNEKSGLEVLVPVHTSDIFKFESKAEQSLKRFNPLPNFNIPIAIDSPPEYKLVKSNWRLIKAHGYHTSSVAIQGNIEYPINKSLLEQHFTPAQSLLLNMDLELDFDIGLVDVSASREELSYDKNTIKNIKQRYELILNDITNIIKDLLDQCSTQWVARQILNDSCDIYGKALINNILSKLLFKNQPISSDAFPLKSDQFTDIFCSWYIPPSFRGVNARRRIGSTFIQPSQNIEIYIDDLKIGAITRVREYVKKTHKTVFLVTANQKRNDSISLYSDLRQFKKQLGGVEIRRASSLPVPVPNIQKKKISKAAARKIANGFIFDKANKRHYAYYKDYWTAKEIDIKSGGYYVDLRTMHVEYLDNGLRVIKALLDSGALHDVYGIPPRQQKKFEKSDGWTKLTTKLVKSLIDNKAKDHIESLDLLFNYHDSKIQSQEVGYLIKGLQNNKASQLKIDLSEDHIINSFLSNYEKTQPLFKEHESLLEVINLLQIEIQGLTTTNDLAIRPENELIERYPLIECGLIGQYNTSSLTNERYNSIINYFKMCDNNKGQNEQ